MMSFPDDIQVRVYGLDEILADLYSEGRQANEKTAEEIINRIGWKPKRTIFPRLTVPVESTRMSS